MRKLFLTLVAGSVVAACGHQKSQSSEASAAEVSTTRSETSTVANPTASPVTGPVSFTDGQTAFTEKRYGDDAARDEGEEQLPHNDLLVRVNAHP